MTDASAWAAYKIAKVECGLDRQHAKLVIHTLRHSDATHPSRRRCPHPASLRLPRPPTARAQSRFDGENFGSKQIIKAI